MYAQRYIEIKKAEKAAKIAKKEQVEKEKTVKKL